MAFKYHLEGGEAVGKTETIAIVAKLLTERGYPVHVADEPSSRKGVQAALRDLAIHSVMSDRVRALIMSASRASLHEDLAELDPNTIVIISRSFVSTDVYQGHDDLREMLDVIRETILGTEKPRICLLECDTDEALRRLGTRPELDVIEKQVINQYEHIRDRYRKMWEYDLTVDTTHASIEQVATQIADRIESLYISERG